MSSVVRRHLGLGPATAPPALAADPAARLLPVERIAGAAADAPQNVPTPAAVPGASRRRPLRAPRPAD